MSVCVCGDGGGGGTLYSLIDHREGTLWFFFTLTPFPSLIIIDAEMLLSKVVHWSLQQQWREKRKGGTLIG